MEENKDTRAVAKKGEGGTGCFWIGSIISLIMGLWLDTDCLVILGLFGLFMLLMGVGKGKYGLL